MIEIHVMNLIAYIVLAFTCGMVLEFLSPTQTSAMIRKKEREQRRERELLNLEN